MVSNTLIEVKTWNYDNHSAPYFILRIELDDNAEFASPTAHSCNYLYEYAFGDSRLTEAIEIAYPGFLPNVVDSYHQLPLRCIQPKKD